MRRVGLGAPPNFTQNSAVSGAGAHIAAGVLAKAYRARTWRARGAATTCDAPLAPPAVPLRCRAPPIHPGVADVAPAECADGAQWRRNLGHGRADVGANRRAPRARFALELCAAELENECRSPPAEAKCGPRVSGCPAVRQEVKWHICHRLEQSLLWAFVQTRSQQPPEHCASKNACEIKLSEGVVA